MLTIVNKLKIKYQSYIKSTNIDVFEQSQKIYICHNPLCELVRYFIHLLFETIKIMKI